jgi:hypothetical protein
MISGTYAKPDAILRSYNDAGAIHKENNASARSNFCIIYESEKGVKVALNQAMEPAHIGARASAVCNFLIKSHKLFTFRRNLRLKVTLCAAPLKACECAERVRSEQSSAHWHVYIYHWAASFRCCSAARHSGPVEIHPSCQHVQLASLNLYAH